MNVPLLFHSAPVDTNEGGLFRVGYYADWTLVTFASTTNNWPQQISLAPRIETSESPETDATGRSAIYLVSQGQVRRFHYRFPTLAALARAMDGAPSTTLTLPDAIAVAIPPNSRELAVSEGRLSIPDRLHRDERVFLGSAAEPGEAYLRIAYEVPPTAGQKLLVSSGIKLMGALVPFLLLLLIPKSKIVRPGLLQWVVGISFGAMVVLLVLTLVAAYRTGRIMEVAPDLVVLVFGILAAAITFLVKKD